MPTRFRIYPDPENRSTLLIDMAKYRVELEFTGEAAAPEPPADAGMEGTRRRPGRRGVLGLFGNRTQRADPQAKLAADAAVR